MSPEGPRRGRRRVGERAVKPFDATTKYLLELDPAAWLRALLYRRHGLPVRGVVVLLRPEADGPELSGHLQQEFPGGEVYLDFRYAVVRVWERPVDEVLSGGLATLPLAPLAAGAEEALPTGCGG